MLRPAAQLILASVAACVHIGAVACEAESGTCQRTPWMFCDLIVTGFAILLRSAGV
jgi:hypothetical protein